MPEGGEAIVMVVAIRTRIQVQRSKLEFDHLLSFSYGMFELFVYCNNINNSHT
jgi:hypothetical protein